VKIPIFVSAEEGSKKSTESSSPSDKTESAPPTSKGETYVNTVYDEVSEKVEVVVSFESTYNGPYIGTVTVGDFCFTCKAYNYSGWEPFIVILDVIMDEVPDEGVFSEEQPVVTLNVMGKPLTNRYSSILTKDLYPLSIFRGEWQHIE